MKVISKEAEVILKEIIENEKTSDYWKRKFAECDQKTDTILRGCFKELRENEFIAVQYADNYPFLIQILKDGFLYFDYLEEKERNNMSVFEKKLTELIENANVINEINKGPTSVQKTAEYTHSCDIWMNDVQIFYNKYLTEHPLANRLNSLLFHRKYQEILACLQSIKNDSDYINIINGEVGEIVPKYKAKMIPEYDVFISHANKDKEDLVEDLYISLNKLGVSIFYDKESLEWGDNWKQRILDGTKKAEFAIIVISENFFDREWTEKELIEFLGRQNRDGQKIILPILHKITIEQLQDKYPLISDIQAIDSERYTTDEIALLFGKQLIKRLKNI